jgi:hypothetical protein
MVIVAKAKPHQPVPEKHLYEKIPPDLNSVSIRRWGPARTSVTDKVADNADALPPLYAVGWGWNSEGRCVLTATSTESEITIFTLIIFYVDAVTSPKKLWILPHKCSTPYRIIISLQPRALTTVCSSVKKGRIRKPIWG